MFQQIFAGFKSPSNTTKLLSNQTADFLQTVLIVSCGGECLDPFLKCLPNSSHNTTLTVTCVRFEDGDFCPVEILREQARAGKLNIFPNCVANNSTCSAFCHQLLRDLRSRLGCCTDSWFTRIPTTVKYFATCSVTLDTPCKPATVTSGTTKMTEMTEDSCASFLSLNLVLVAALFLVAASTVVWLTKGMSALHLEPGFNSGSTRVACVHTELSFDESELNPGRSQRTSWCGLKRV